MSKLDSARRRGKDGDRVMIPVAMLEFTEGGNTLWVHSPLGGTVLRIKVDGKIISDSCQNSPISHADIMASGDVRFCVSTDAS